MKKLFKKIKSYSFWVSLSASIVLLLNAIGNAFGFKIEEKIVNDVVMSLAGVLVVLGVVSMNGASHKKDEKTGEGEEKTDDSAGEKDDESQISNGDNVEKNDGSVEQKIDENKDKNGDEKGENQDKIDL